MDASEAQTLQRSRPQYPRVSSRSSTSTTHTRMTSQSASSATSHTTSSPQLANSHPVHRLHHANCLKPSSSPRPSTRTTGQLSREVSSESTRQQAVSSFLQEKLQRERKAESVKMAHVPALSRLNTGMSASLDLGRPSQPSPFRTSHSEDLRPMSSAGFEPGKRQGLGVKDMEHVISGLHKQNFDLKLELYHRREKQAMLESNIDNLESDKNQMVEMNDSLLEELEKRDKAVEEAVAMIVTLEAKLDRLRGMQTMVQQVEPEAFFCPQDVVDTQYLKPSPEIHAPRFADDDKVINRMPSFLSERSENTENLRNVYLGVRGSVLSLPRVAEGTSEADNGPVNGLASPTLSVLSESSFVSVYGKKSQHEGFPPPVEEPLSLDGADINRPYLSHHHEESHNMTKGKAAASPVRAATANCFSRGGHTSDPFHAMSDIMGHGSGMPPAEHRDRNHGPLKEAFRPSHQGRERRGSQPILSNMQQGRKLTKEEKREALRAVTIDANGGVRLHDQNFPPTPDTISTSTLHRMRSSNDSLPQPQDGRNERTSTSYHDTDDANEKHPEKTSGVSLREKPAAGQRTTQKMTANQIYGHNGAMIQRPRSASETTGSRNRADNWDSDSDEDSDVRSLESSLDIWMKESTKPTRNGGRVSPHQTRLPITSSSNPVAWATDSMFRPNDMQPDVHGIGPSANYMNDLFSLRQALFAANAPPPLPDRKSSLHARTISTSDSIRMVPTSPKQEADQRAGHFRRQSDVTQMRSALRTPIQQQLAHQPPPNSDHKKNHYPPIAGQHGPRSGFNRLFRRSIGSGSSLMTESAPSTATEATFPEAAYNTPSMGASSWTSRNTSAENDRTGATPPPIMLNPRQMRRNTAGAEAKPDFIASVPSTPVQTSERSAGRQTPTAQTPTSGQVTPTSGTGMRRKWLPGFRQAASNLKNRAG